MRLTREEAISYLKEKCIEDFLQYEMRLPITKNFQCFDSSKHKHKDKNPSMRYNRKASNVHCFACGLTMDIYDLIGIKFGLSEFKEQFKKGCELYNIEIVRESRGEYKKMEQKKPEEPEVMEDFTEYFAKCNKALNENYNEDFYLAKRGISLETCNRFLVGLDKTYKNSEYSKQIEAVIIPTSIGTFVPRDTSATPEKRFLVKAGMERKMFNAEALHNAETPVIITEAEIDSLSVEEVGGTSVGLGGTGQYRRLIEELEKRENTQPLILALDNDESGRKCTEQITEAVREGISNGSIKPEAATYLILNPYGNVKDANDRLQQNREKFEADIQGITKNPYAWQYQKQNCAASYIKDFTNGIAASVNTPVISTGFKELDKRLDGGLYEGLYVWGAVSSLGKTTIINQISDNIAQNGTDIIYISLEMARTELMAKSISRLTYVNVRNGEAGGDIHAAKTTRGITDGSRYVTQIDDYGNIIREGYSEKEKELIGLSVRDYSEYAGNLYIHEGVGDIGTKQIHEIVKRHISLTGRRPVVFIDYLQILAPYNDRFTEKQNTDANIRELKRISRDFKTPVIAISNLNRMSYLEEVTETSFKESGGIEYGVDCLMGLQYRLNRESKNIKAEFQEAKERTPREVELVILKNRNAAVHTTPMQFDFYPQFNYFEEV